jgi:hypothetical protein
MTILARTKRRTLDHLSSTDEQNMFPKKISSLAMLLCMAQPQEKFLFAAKR